MKRDNGRDLFFMTTQKKTGFEVAVWLEAHMAPTFMRVGGVSSQIYLNAGVVTYRVESILAGICYDPRRESNRRGSAVN